MGHVSSPKTPGTPGTYPLDPLDHWEAFLLGGEHVGFLHRHLADGVLTTRTAFQPRPEQRRQNPMFPERFMSQCQVHFTADGSTWTELAYEDSASAQRVRIERERAGVDADVVPSYADGLLARAVAEAGEPLIFRRLEEGSPLQGPVRVIEATLAPTAVESAPGGDGAEARRIELRSEGQVLGIHWVRDDALTGSDWGAGSVSVPVDSQEAALHGLHEDLATFARMPR